MKEKDKEFLDHLESVFDENEEGLNNAFESLKDRPNKDGMLFSKEFREHMAPYGDRGPVEMLQDKNFWKHLAKYAGMSDEEFENITKGKK